MSRHWSVLHYQSTLSPAAHQLWCSIHSTALANECGGQDSNMAVFSVVIYWDAMTTKAGISAMVGTG